MAKPNLADMTVDALLKLRDDVGAALSRRAKELESQLSRLGGEENSMITFAKRQNDGGHDRIAIDTARLFGKLAVYDQLEIREIFFRSQHTGAASADAQARV